MKTKEVLAELKKLGTEQNRKIYTKHGADPTNIYGVSFANLYKLEKKIKIDHALALELWDTKNSDARTLALLIADPEKLTEKIADTWVKQSTFYMISSMIAGLIAKTPFADKKMKEWMESKEEYICQSGYDVLSMRLYKKQKLPVHKLETYLVTIEQKISSSPNRTKHAMNMALISIGGYCPTLTNKAIAAAKRIGKVDVDHGDTSCKTPDAIGYIDKIVKRRK